MSQGNEEYLTSSRPIIFQDNDTWLDVLRHGDVRQQTPEYRVVVVLVQDLQHHGHDGRPRRAAVVGRPHGEVEPGELLPVDLALHYQLARLGIEVEQVRYRTVPWMK